MTVCDWFCLIKVNSTECFWLDNFYIVSYIVDPLATQSARPIDKIISKGLREVPAYYGTCCTKICFSVKKRWLPIEWSHQREWSFISSVSENSGRTIYIFVVFTSYLLRYWHFPCSPYFKLLKFKSGVLLSMSIILYFYIIIFRFMILNYGLNLFIS